MAAKAGCCTIIRIALVGLLGVFGSRQGEARRACTLTKFFFSLRWENSPLGAVNPIPNPMRPWCARVAWL